jgi:RNA polymerase sigma-70 factor (ECF subfamily)
MTDQEAVARLKRRDISGLEALVRRYHARALDSAYLVLGDWALAEDVAQATFVKAYDRIDGFDTSRAFGPWFLRSVVNSALDVSAGRRDISLEVYMDTQGVDIPSPEPGVVELLEAAETREEVLSALRELSPVQRAAIVMKYYFDMSDVEASNRLDVPAGTVRRRLHDARKRLQKLLPLSRSE